ncbi:MarR family winged helix-turn-helix transcriptional regulator [Halotalea alkalilenta]|uniref:MarR family winged helix-turn-helix transcriptional regulator n=1 Tax=Halotalea alkalilenta TaxID=376489 RepID=UPI00138E1581|nr:MarR family transcriptional regulator [Halotalea alkalilenta]
MNRRIEGALSQRLKAEGLSLEHYRILTALVEENGRTMSDLATWAMVDPPTMTKMIDRLVASGFVFRAPDPNDRRKVLVFISDVGRSVYKAAETPAMAFEEELGNVLPAVDRAELTRLLQSLLK